MPNLRSLLMLFYTIFCILLAIVGLVINPSGRLYVWIARRVWSPPLLRIGGIRLAIRGGESLDWSRPYVVVCNHASQVDIPVIFASLHMPVRFMAKKSLFYIPIFGWSLWLAKFIPVDRSGPRKARASVNLAARRIRNGPSLIVFPEGTRSVDGTLGPFKSGAFVMALKAGVPILPVAIRGSHRVFPRSTLRMTPGDIEVIVGRPIPTEGIASTEKDALRAETRHAVAAMLESGLPPAAIDSPPLS